MKSVISIFIAFISLNAMSQNPWGFCEPTVTNGTNFGDFITMISYNGDAVFESYNGDFSYYYLDMPINMTIGTTNYISVMNSTETSNEYLEIFMDMNGDGVFSDFESSFPIDFNSVYEVADIPVALPSDLAPKVFMIRFILHYWGNEEGACGTYQYGQVVDLVVSANSDSQGYCVPNFDRAGLYGDYLNVMYGSSTSVGGNGIFSAEYYFFNNEYENATAGIPSVFSCTGGQYSDGTYSLFVDEDMDGFDSGDFKDSHNVNAADETFQLTYTPTSGISGNYRARLITSDGVMADPCGTAPYGMCIDFYITVTNANADPYCNVTSMYGTVSGDYIGSLVVDDSGIGSGQFTQGPYYTNYAVPGTSNVLYALPNRMVTGQIESGYYNGTEYYDGWIDYDMNNVFDGNEKMFEIFTSGPYQLGNFSFNHPNYVGEGLTRMRFTCSYANPPASACDFGSYGEAEDYYVVKVASNDLYCDPYFGMGNSDGDFISAVQFQQVNLTNVSSELTSFYKNLTGNIAQVLAGQSYPLTIQSGSYGVDFFKAWIDWNGDGIFDNATESVGNAIEGTGAFQSHTWNVAVPSDQSLGNYRMRIICAYDLEPTPCMEANFGEYVELTVAVVTNIGLENWIANEIRVYPNPSSGILNVSLANNEMVQAIVYDMTGKMVDQFKIQGFKSWSHQLEPGVYSLQVSLNGVSKTTTFIVE